MINPCKTTAMKIAITTIFFFLAFAAIGQQPFEACLEDPDKYHLYCDPLDEDWEECQVYIPPFQEFHINDSLLLVESYIVGPSYNPDSVILKAANGWVIPIHDPLFEGGPDGALFVFRRKILK
jgi:hypothetical protein